MTINLIRHGKTAGNLEKRYIGRTDESLCEIGIAEIKNIDYPDCEYVIVSPMKRCIETAKLIYPRKKIIAYKDLRECDFGDFEGKNHIALSGNKDYQKWINSGGLGSFPNGEDSKTFRDRCVSSFWEAAINCPLYETVSFIVHGGTIMSILEKLAVPHKDFYEFMTENGHGYVTVYDGKKLKITDEI